MPIGARKEKTFTTANFLLNPKRLKLYQLQQFAKTLDLPSASGDDMLVMISGKPTESNYEPPSALELTILSLKLVMNFLTTLSYSL